MSGPNPGLGDKRVVSVLNHMLLSLCHTRSLRETDNSHFVTCFRGKRKILEDWEQITSIPIDKHASPYEIRT